MRVVILTGGTSSGVFGGMTPAPGEDGHDPEWWDGEYLHGEHGRELIGDADLVVAVWAPSDEPIIVRAPEGVTVQALQEKWRGGGTGDWQDDTTSVRLRDAITQDEFRDRMTREAR